MSSYELIKKKTYKKPELFYESFTLSQDIASGCEGIALFGENVCGVKVNMMDMIIYGYGSGACDYQPPNPESYICYHAPSDANNVFQFIKRENPVCSSIGCRRDYAYWVICQ